MSSKNIQVPVSCKDYASLNPLFKLRNLIIDNWRDDKKYFLGRVLTIIDASTSDTQQRKALKDLIEQAFYDKSFREESVREILISFANKFAKDMVPVKEEKEVFLGRIGSGEGFPAYDYFEDYK